MLAEIFQFVLVIGVAGGSLGGLVIVHELVRRGVNIEIGKVIWLLAIVTFIYANARTGLWRIAWDFLGSVGWYAPLVLGGVGVFFMSIIQMEGVQARWVAKQNTALDQEVRELRKVAKQMKMKMEELQ